MNPFILDLAPKCTFHQSQLFGLWYESLHQLSAKVCPILSLPSLQTKASISANESFLQDTKVLFPNFFFLKKNVQQKKSSIKV